MTQPTSQNRPSTNTMSPASEFEAEEAAVWLESAAPEVDAIPDALAAAFADAAVKRGLADAVFRTLETPVGALTLVATERGLVSVTFDGDRPDATLERLAAELGGRIVRADARLAAQARAIEALTEGRAAGYALPLDLRLATGFRRTVVDALRDIPRGETRSYLEVARAVGSPGAVRAVGTACRRNPLPIVVPCHRVRRTDGSLGQYAGGVEAKRTLLAAEGVVLA